MYDVGQIIYLYKSGSDGLFPCVVAEQVIKKTLEGEKVTYTVLLPDDQGSLLDLSKINAKYFSSIDEFKSFYIKEAQNKMNNSISQCRAIEINKFKKFQKNVEENVNDDLKLKTKKENKDVQKITINDENNVKLNIDLSKLEEMGL